MKTLRLLAVLAAAFAGGAFANFAMRAMPALAQEEPAKPEKPAIPQTLEAQSFVLKDKDGNVRATLALDDNAMPGLKLNDAAGTERARLALVKRADDKINASLRTCSEAGKTNALLVGYAEGEASLTLYDGQTKPRVSLDVNADKTATINVRSVDGTRNITLAAFETAPGEHKPKFETKKETPANPEGGEGKPAPEAPAAKGPNLFLRTFSDGTSDILIVDREGGQRVDLGVSEAGISGLVIKDKEERPSLVQGVWADGTRGQDIYFSNGKLASFLGVDEDGNIGHTLKDAEGKFGISTLVNRKGATGMRIYGSDETLRGQLILNASQVPQLNLCDAAGKIRALLGAFSDCTQLQLNDKEGVIRLLNSQWDDGDVASSLYNAEHKPRIGMQINGEDSELRVWDGAGNQRATVGHVSRQARLGVYDAKVTFRAGSWVDDKADSASSTVRNKTGSSVWEQSGK